MIDAITTAHTSLSPLLALQSALATAAGKSKREVDLVTPPDDVVAAAFDILRPQVEKEFYTEALSKSERGRISDELRAAVHTRLVEQFPDVDEALLPVAATAAMKQCFRDVMLTSCEPDTEPDVQADGSAPAPLYVPAKLPPGRRVDHRDSATVRPLTVEVDVLPAVHGSALFGRGVTQSLCTATLGPPQSAQKWRAVAGSHTLKNFFLHYDFPPYCINETGRVGGINRRMVGHGALAEKAVLPVVNETEPYTIRVTSEVSGSDGSSSMASVCGASLALMDAGVGISQHVAGVSVGLVTPPGGLQPGDQYVLLTDILGLEDFFGDMDFKVAGTADGITALQLDIKPAGLPLEVITTALRRASSARMHLLDAMRAVIAETREEPKASAPCMRTVEVPDDMTGKVIGSGGSVLRRIEAETEASVNLADGVAVVFAPNADAAAAACAMVQDILDGDKPPFAIGDDVEGKVKELLGFGAVLEFPSGATGFLHISELDVGACCRGCCGFCVASSSRLLVFFCALPVVVRYGDRSTPGWKTSGM